MTIEHLTGVALDAYIKDNGIAPDAKGQIPCAITHISGDDPCLAPLQEWFSHSFPPRGYSWSDYVKTHRHYPGDIKFRADDTLDIPWLFEIETFEGETIKFKNMLELDKYIDEHWCPGFATPHEDGEPWPVPLLPPAKPKAVAVQGQAPATVAGAATSTATWAERALQREHFARDAGGRLYVHRGGCYQPSGERALSSLLKPMMGSAWTTHRVKEIIEFIRVDAPELWTTPPLDKINLLNGILDVKTRTLSPHSHDFLSAVQLPVNFDPAPRCRAWEKFCQEVFPADALDLPWQVVAWLMVPDVGHQVALIFIGDGCNGKSVFLSALVNFLGKKNVAAISLHRLEQDKFSVARLVGKLANVAADLPSKDLDGSASFKAITGNDLVQAERKFAESFEFTPFARLIFSANHPPRSKDSSGAFFRRWVVVPFERTFAPGEIIPRPILDARLADPGELSGVLNRALDTLPEFQKSGFTISSTMKAAHDDFRQTTDPVAVWLQRETVQGAAMHVTKSDLVAAYNRMADTSGRPGISPHSMTRAVKGFAPEVREGQRIVGGSLLWCWIGLGLRSGRGESD